MSQPQQDGAVVAEPSQHRPGSSGGETQSAKFGDKRSRNLLASAAVAAALVAVVSFNVAADYSDANNIAATSMTCSATSVGEELGLDLSSPRRECTPYNPTVPTAIGIVALLSAAGLAVAAVASHRRDNDARSATSPPRADEGGSNAMERSAEDPVDESVRENVADRLERLQELHSDGLISDQELVTQRRRILQDL